MMKEKLILIFIFAQVFGFGQNCLEIEFVQEAGSSDLQVRSLFNYSSDFNSSHYEIDRLLNASDTVVTKDVETRQNHTNSITNTITIMPIKEKKFDVQRL